MGLMDMTKYNNLSITMANVWIIVPLLTYISHTLGELHGVRLRHDNFDCYNHRPIIKHGHYEVLRKDGHVIRAHCDVGYFMIGSGLRLCQMHEKRFTGEEPRCEDVDECALMANMTATDEGSAAGVDDEDEEDAPVPCHSRATCINTPGSYRCQCPEGLYGSGFHCEEPATCDQPDTPPHAHILQHTLNIIRFYCHPDYSIRGNDTLICHDGQWSSKPPRCVPGWKTCGDPGIPENGYRLGNRFYLGSVARFWCRNGFELKGPKFILCQEDTESWTSVIPECAERETPIQGNVEKLEVIRVTDEMAERLIADEDKQYSMYSTKPVDIMNAVKDNFIRYDTYGEDGSYHREDREGNRMLTYEWLAEIRNATSPYEPALCYGVFICSDWVLTAAKCLQQYRNRVIKLFEPVDLIVYINDELLKVHKILRHPRYFFGHHGHDVAVIKVEKPWRRQQEAIEILDPKSPAPSLLEMWSRESGRTEVDLYDHSQCPQEGPYRLTSDTVCVQQTIPLGTPLVARWKFPDEPERYFLLAVAKETRGVLMTDVRKHHRWVLTATEGCDL